jgi:hypothetical protein
VTRAKRGEIWMADLGVAAKVRPVLVLSVAYEVKSGQSSAMSCVQPACAILGTKCVTKLVVCRNGAFDAQDLGSYQRSNSKGEWDTSTPRRNMDEPTDRKVKCGFLPAIQRTPYVSVKRLDI